MNFLINRPLCFLALIAILSACSQRNGTISFDSGHWVDLSYAYSENTLYWPTAEGFVLDTAFEGETDGGYYYSAFNFRSAEHGGTHLDAPIHFAKGAKSSDELELSQLTGLAVVVDVSKNVGDNRDYLISVDDFKNWEKHEGKIPNNAILLLRTGHGRFWPNAEQYLGTAEKGADAVAKLHFPGLSPEAAEWLVNNRSIKAIGIDTPSIDYGQSTDFMSHRILFKENIPAFENLANMEELPVLGAYVVALPMKIEGGSGGPLRIVAYLNQ